MFRFLEHPSEEYVEVEAPSVEEVFREGALALFEIMTDTLTVKPMLSFEIQVQASDRNMLFVDWLNRLILLHEIEKVFLSRFEVKVETGENSTVFSVVHGEKISASHERRAHAKSATFGQFEWHEIKNGHRVRFVVDI
jgi:SHS2 domain-containing protein